MKRSEVIDIIKTNVNLFIYDNQISEQDAETVLIHLESIGMSPPEYLPEPQYCEVTGKQLECKPVRKWEKE